MAAVEVAKLRLRCDARQRDRTQFAIEDALRTSIPDDRRLVLLQKMRIGGRLESANPAQRQAAVKNGWLAAIAGARHGGDDGAGNANCVWFSSRDEAEALLLERLLAGRSVDGWFWKLALPGWHGRPLGSWLPECVSDALARGEDRRLLAIARICVAAGATDRLVEALAGRAHIEEGPPAPRPAGASLSPFPSSSPTRFNAQQSNTGGAAELALPVPAKLRTAIASLVRTGGEAGAAAQAIVRAWVVSRSPALAISPKLLAETVAATVDAVVARRVVEPPRHGPADRPPPSPTAGRAVDSPAPTRTMPKERPVSGNRTARSEQAGAAPETSAAAEPAPAPAAPEAEPRTGHRRHSRHAGLWLVVPSLVELGFREWLADRPDLLGDNPGGQLLQAIARHHRVPPDDPALAILGDPIDTGAFPAWSRLWRHGLDRWLRRTVRRRLHDLVNRPGHLDWDELRIDIRFPAADADLALRRRALDRDPGWTDWLGLSIRYHFGGAEDWL